MTAREILEEFAAFRIGVDTYEVNIFRRKDPRGYSLDSGFDIEDPRAMAAECARLERILRARPAPSLKPSVAEQRSGKRAPCEVCGAACAPNALGPVARYCSDDCRKLAHYKAKVESGKCLKSTCLSGAEAGKTYCRPHLDDLAAKGRERRRAQTETRKAAA